MKATTSPFGTDSESASAGVNDAESRMRLRLGLAGAANSAPAAPQSSDPLKGARQAIRSQAAAREYVERQLAHAEASIQDLRNKLHQAYRAKDTAVEEARLATVARTAAQRIAHVTEAALASEKTARERADRALREAQASVRDLQTRLDSAARGQEEAKAELAAERLARQKAEAARREEIAVRRAAPSVTRDEADEPRIKRPVGRPRKIVAPAVVADSELPAAKAPDPVEIIAKKPAKPAAKGRVRPTGEQEPVQWWVEGWNRRAK
jgi:hypothetical protein